ncbi:MAG: hypothetical protein FWH14_01245 [Oscillospiraceae bacterium]|nr:hypothetical protein [Oscillospiraceae bacterium]
MIERKPFELAVKNIGNLLFSKILCVIFIIMAIGLIDMTEGVILPILFQLFLFVMFFTFLYLSYQREGDHDRNFIDLGRMKPDLFKGAKSGAYLAIPSFLLNLLFLLSKCGLFSDEFFGIYKLLNAQYLPVLIILDQGGTPLSSEISWWVVAVGFLLVLLIPALTGAAYYLGYNRIAISQYVFYKNKKGKKRL